MTFDIEKNLTEKLGPLPGYAWVLLGVGGVFWYRKSHPGGSIRSSSVASPIANSSTPATDASVSGATNNAQWASKAAQNLYGSSAYSAPDITDALNSYLSGTSLTSGQQGIINAAIAGLGNQPDNFGIDPAQYDAVTAASNLTNIAASQEGNNAATSYNDLLAATYDLGFQPDITPGYNNPPGFSGTAANDGPAGTNLNSPTIPVGLVSPSVKSSVSSNKSGPMIGPSLSLSGTSVKGD